MSVQLVLPPRTIALFAISVAAIGVISLGYLYLPKAKITIAPKINVRQVDQEIVLSSKAKEPDFVRFVLPARLVETTVETRKSYDRASSGTSEDFARGQVTLHNQQDEQQELLPKSHLRHEASGKFFLTDKAVSIPAHGEIAVSVTAKEKGESGNVKPGKFIVDKLPASLQSEVYAESKQVFTGGVATSSALSADEIEKNKQELLVESKQQALGQLTAQAGGASISPDLTTVEVASENISAAAGSRAAQYEIALNVKAKGVVIDSNDLLSLTLLALRAQETADEEFLAYNPDSFRYSINRADFSSGEILVKGQLSGRFSAKIGSGTLNSSNVAGLTTQETKEHFEQLPNVESAEVVFSPFWVRSAPSRPEAIEIIIKSN